jgi:hypothetical protein
LIIRGGLELMWEPAYDTGDPYIGDADDIEGTVGWPGPPGAFCEALLSAGGEGRAGFIEPAEGGGFIIHDFWDHAPDYVRKRRARERQREERGAELSRFGQRPVTDQPVTGQRPPSPDCQTEDGRTPSPAPSPAPRKEKELLLTFDRFWSVYPRKVGRAKARSTWLRLAPSDETVKAILAAVERAKKSPQWQDDGGRYIPHPTTWLAQERWTDELDAQGVNGSMVADEVWGSAPMAYACTNPDCPEPPDMRAHLTPECPHRRTTAA